MPRKPRDFSSGNPFKLKSNDESSSVDEEKRREILQKIFGPPQNKSRKMGFSSSYWGNQKGRKDKEPFGSTWMFAFILLSIVTIIFLIYYFTCPDRQDHISIYLIYLLVAVVILLWFVYQ